MQDTHIMSGSRGRQPRSHHSAARGRDSTGSRRHDSARGGGDSTGGRIHDSAHGHDSTGSRPQDSSPNDRQRQGCTRFTPLSAHDAENLGRGYAGSTSDVGISDQMDDTQRIIKRRRVHEAHNSGIDPDNDSEEDDDDTQRDSNVADTPHRYGDTRPYLEKFGKKYVILIVKFMLLTHIIKILILLHFTVVGLHPIRYIIRSDLYLINFWMEHGPHLLSFRLQYFSKCFVLLG